MRNVLSEKLVVEKNNIIIPLENFYVEIKQKAENSKPYFHLSIRDINGEQVIFSVNSLEEAFEFTEDVVANTETIDEVLKAFRNRIERQKRGLKG